MSFQIGDAVEVIKESFNCLGWKGRRLIVTGFNPSITGLMAVMTAPFPSSPGVGWHPSALRKIDPPDFSASSCAESTVSA